MHIVVLHPGPRHQADGSSAAQPSSTAVKPAGTSDWSRTAAQSPVARKSIRRMMSLMNDPEVSGMLALMKTEDNAGATGFDAVNAYHENS